MDEKKKHRGSKGITDCWDVGHDGEMATPEKQSKVGSNRNDKKSDASEALNETSEVGGNESHKGIRIRATQNGNYTWKLGTAAGDATDTLYAPGWGRAKSKIQTGKVANYCRTGKTEPPKGWTIR